MNRPAVDRHSVLMFRGTALASRSTLQNPVRHVKYTRGAVIFGSRTARTSAQTLALPRMPDLSFNSGMSSDAAKFRVEAEQCRIFAERASTPEIATGFAEIARQWERLAQDAENNQKTTEPNSKAAN
jgi:hypothetical protein